MIERGQRAVAADAQAQPLARRRAMADRAVHLVAAQHQLDRPPDQPGGEDAQDLRPGDQALRAEAAAEERAADKDLLRRDAEQPGDAAARHHQALARRVDRQRIAVPGGDDGVRLHRVVVLRRRLVGRVDPRGGRREARFDIAFADLGGRCRPRRRAARSFRRRRGRRAPARPRIAAAAAPRPRRRLQRLGDHHRDRLVGVAHPVVLQHVEPEHERVGLLVGILRQRRAVGRRHHLDHARGALAAATSSEVTRPRAMLLTAITAYSMPGGWLSAA